MTVRSWCCPPRKFRNGGRKSEIIAKVLCKGGLLPGRFNDKPFVRPIARAECTLVGGMRGQRIAAEKCVPAKATQQKAAL